MTTFPLVLITFLGVGVSCAKSSAPQVVPEESPAQMPAGFEEDPFGAVPGDAAGDYGAGDYNDQFEDSDFAGASDCQPGDCDKKKVSIRAVNVENGAFLSKLNGFTLTMNAWGFKGTTTGDGRRIMARLESLPGDAEVLEENGVLVLVWFPETATSGSVKVVARDVDLCIADNADDEDMQAGCEDLEIKSGFSKFETSKSFSYSIRKDAQTEALERQELLQEKQLQAQCTAGLLGAAATLFATPMGASPNVGAAIGASTPCFL